MDAPGNERTRRAIRPLAGVNEDSQQHTRGGYACQAISGLEMSVCGTIISEPEQADSLVPQISPDMFMDPTCRAVARAIIQSHEQGQPVDVESIFHAMGDKVDRLWFDDAIDAANEFSFAHHANTLRDAANQRRKMEIARLIQDAVAAGDDAAELIQQLQQVGTDRRCIAKVRALSSLCVDCADDPTELLKHRFLCRTGGLLLVGPTGIGKSSFILQGAVAWAAGCSHFGIIPKAPMRCLIVQAENDDGDIAEMRDGVVSGMVESGIISGDRAEQALQRVFIARDVTSAGDGFGAALDRYISETKPDLVILDPAFSYLGGESNSAQDVGHFLRGVVNPVILKHHVGIIICHHTNKPLAGKEKSDWQAGDFAYLGAGSAEWANWARAVIAIRSIGSDTVFQLVAAKRGGRLRWDDEEGTRTTTRFIAHGTSGIYWRPVTGEEAMRGMSRGGAKAHYSGHLEKCLEIAQRQVWPVGLLKREIATALDISSDRSIGGLIQMISEAEGFSRETYYDGRRPVHLIGTREAVKAAIRGRCSK